MIGSNTLSSVIHGFIDTWVSTSIEDMHCCILQLHQAVQGIELLLALLLFVLLSLPHDASKPGWMIIIHLLAARDDGGLVAAVMCSKNFCCCSQLWVRAAPTQCFYL
jgi:hypothetical protein